jgi:hypothetical protein
MVDLGDTEAVAGNTTGAVAGNSTGTVVGNSTGVGPFAAILAKAPFNTSLGSNASLMANR